MASHEKSIVVTLADYREGEITPISTADVDRWISQFDATDRDILLAETDRILKAHYVSTESSRTFIDDIWGTTDLVGEDPAATIEGIKFLDVQRKGSSQKTMLDVARESLETTLGLDLDECGEPPSAYIYLDDGMFSGNTVVHDLTDEIPKMVKGSELHMIFLSAHDGGVRYVGNRLGPILHKQNMRRHIWVIPKHGFQNFPWQNESHQLLWPTKVTGDKFVDAYVEHVKKACDGKNFSPRLFRPQPRAKEDVFSSLDDRQAVESAFLRKGAYIVAQCQNPGESMRPLGYEYLSSLGFGALVVTYRNIANNCPLALWWGDPTASKSHPFSKWFPLIPRRSNQQTALSSVFNNDFSF